MDGAEAIFCSGRGDIATANGSVFFTLGGASRAILLLLSSPFTQKVITLPIPCRKTHSVMWTKFLEQQSNFRIFLLQCLFYVFQCFTFNSTEPRSSMSNPPMCSNNSLHWREQWIRIAEKERWTQVLPNSAAGMTWQTAFTVWQMKIPIPLDSILDAVFTVSPNRQYRGILCPTTPATQDPAQKKLLNPTQAAQK